MELSEIHRFNLTIPQPFSFPLTVAKPAGWHWSTPGEIFGNGALWTGMYLRDIPLGLRLSARGTSVKTVVYGRESLSGDMAALLKRDIRAALGGDEDLPGFYRFARRDPILSVVTEHLHGMRVGMVKDLFGDVILAILLQMAPMARSNQMIDAVLGQYGIPLTFDGREVTLWPRPEEIARIDPEELRRTAKLGYRAERLVRAARFLVEHPIPQEDLAHLPEGEAVARVTEIPGIGPYSAAIILGMFPIDVWSVVIFSELFMNRRPRNPRAEIDRVVSRLTKRWGKWRWYAFVYVVQDLSYLSEKYHLSRVT
jgi:DNA-3-methyladenine glycosylase II